MPDDDRPTVVAIGAIAYLLANVAHQVVGHAAGFVIARWRSCALTTNRLIETQKLGGRGGEIFDLGGPAGNRFMALVAWSALLFLPERFARFIGVLGPEIAIR